MATPKKYVYIGAGITTIAALLVVLSGIYGVHIESSGDIECQDTCVSYFNVTSENYTIYIRNPDGIKLDFQPGLRNYTVYRYVSKVWKPVDLTNITLTRGTKYQFKIVGTKFSPLQVVKWNVRASDAYLDPVWNGVELTTSTENHCNKDSCYITSYGGTRFVQEKNGSWVKIEESKVDLLKYYDINYIEQDKGFGMEFIELNNSFVKLKLTVNKTYVNKSVPLQLRRCIALDNEDTLKGCLTWETINQTVSFSNDRSEAEASYNFKTLARFIGKNPLSYQYKFGYDSTVLSLHAADTEILDDAHAIEQAPTTPQGDSTTIAIQSRFSITPKNYRVYIKFINSVPAGNVIEDAALFIYVNEAGGQTPYTISINHVLNQHWTEENLTWNTQPCGTAFDNAGDCNLTIMSSNVTANTQILMFIRYNVTDAVIRDYAASSANISFAQRMLPENNVTSTYRNQAAKESADATVREFLNITYTGGAPPTEYPSADWKVQTPADVSSTNLIGASRLNISYNISSKTYGINNVTTKLYHRTNTTTNNVWEYRNGTAFIAYVAASNYTNVTSNPGQYDFYLDDNGILPGTYNINEDFMESTLHNHSQLTNQNDYVKMTILNMTGAATFSFLEFMGRNATVGAAPFRAYYCNSTYTTGLVTGDANCITIGVVLSTQAWNHTHSAFSGHFVVPLGINNTTSTLSGVKVTPVSYFLFRGPQTGTWNYSDVNNVTREDHVQTTGNGGATWSNYARTVDMHVHQFNGTYTLNYYVCANDTQSPAMENCTFSIDEKHDMLELGGIPPSAPGVTAPTEAIYNPAFTINISFVPSVSPNSYEISFYNISLNYANGTYIKTVKANNSLNSTYEYHVNKTTDVSNNSYVFRVYAWDSLGQSNFGDSSNFTIKDIIPPVSDNVSTNSTDDAIRGGEAIKLSSQAFDESGIIDIKLETNETGTWKNRSLNSFFTPVKLEYIGGGCNDGDLPGVSNPDYACDGNWTTNASIRTNGSQLFINFSYPSPVPYNPYINMTSRIFKSSTLITYLRLYNGTDWNIIQNWGIGTYATANFSTSIPISAANATDNKLMFLFNTSGGLDEEFDVFENSITYNYSLLANSTWNWTNYTWANASIFPSAPYVVGWRFYYTDYYGNEHQTSGFNFTINSGFVQWSANSTSIATPSTGTERSFFNVTWKNGTYGVSKVYFESNYSGTPTNYSMNSTYGNGIYNYSAIIPAGTYYWKSYANDSSNHWNTSDTWTLFIGNLSIGVDLPSKTYLSIEDGTTMSYLFENLTWATAFNEPNNTEVEGGQAAASFAVPYYSWYKFNISSLTYFESAFLNLKVVPFTTTSAKGYDCNSSYPCVTELFYTPNQTWSPYAMTWTTQATWYNYVVDRVNVSSNNTWVSYNITNHFKSILSNSSFMLRIPSIPIQKKAMNISGGYPALDTASYPYVKTSVTKYRMNASSCTLGGTTCYKNGTFQPNGQTNLTAIFNITNTGTVANNVSVWWNTTLPACITHFLSTNSTLETSADFNVSNSTVQRILTNYAVGSSTYYWGFFKLNNCTAGATTNVTLRFNATTGA